MKTVLANKRWAQRYPRLGTGPVPAEPCISPQYFALEGERIFRRVWLNVGRVEDLPEPGDYVVHDLAVCNASVLLVRGKDGVIRGFHNVCSHRGNKVVWDAKGNCPGVWSCGFHSWTYNTRGELTWVPDEENFFDLKKAELGLSPITTEIWEGFIFITLDPNPRESLPEYLGGVAEQLGGGQFERWALTYAYQVEEQANWKIALDAQNELYHLPFQHRLTIPDFCVRNEARYTRLLDLRLYNYHSVYASETPEGGVPSPVQALTFRLDAAAAPCRLPRIGDFDFYTIFPNFVILLFKGAAQDFYMTYHFWPLAVDRTRWDIKLYFPPAEHAAHRLSQEYMKCLARDVLHEDALAHEAIHSGLASQAKTQLFFQDEEIQLRHFHQVVEGYVGFYEEA